MLMPAVLPFMLPMPVRPFLLRVMGYITGDLSTNVGKMSGTKKGKRSGTSPVIAPITRPHGRAETVDGSFLAFRPAGNSRRDDFLGRGHQT